MDKAGKLEELFPVFMERDEKTNKLISMRLLEHNEKWNDERVNEESQVNLPHHQFYYSAEDCQDYKNSFFTVSQDKLCIFDPQ